MKTEFIPGRLYESLYTNTVVKCISDDGAYSFNFTGVVVSSSIEYPIGHESNEWTRSSLELEESESTEKPILNVLL